MSHFSFIKFISFSALVLILILIGVSFIKNDFQPLPRAVSGSLEETLASQSSLKKFNSLQELKTFFDKRPVVNAQTDYFAMETRDAGLKNMAPTTNLPSATSRGFGGELGMGSGPVFSNTNIQVAGVDEADLVKTDGEFIYMIKETELLIIKALPATSPTIVSTIALSGTAQELYIHNNQLAVFGYSQSEIVPSASIMPRYYSPTTFLAFYDIQDRSQVTLIREFEFEGSYISSRVINNQLYFITAYNNFYPLAEVALPRVFENDAVISADHTTDSYIFPSIYYIDSPAMLNATTISVINFEDIEAPLNSQIYLLPAGETVYASTQAIYLAYTKYVSEYQLRMAVTRELIAPRMSQREQQRLAAINSIDSAILSEEEKLYKINQLLEGYIQRLSLEEQNNINNEIQAEFTQRHPKLADELEKTVIHKIGISGSELTYIASGEVTGHLLNQYSLDERDGNLRLATSRSQNWFQPFMLPVTARPNSEGEAATLKIAPPPVQSESINNVYVLDQTLKTIGSLEGLAPGERIYSARFLGERVYLVTFKQTDPLFVIDLAVPENPTVLGELKLPGFSNYLHPYSDTMLIGIGKDAIDKGDQGVELLGLKISLFDVAEPSNPKEVSSLVLGGRGSDSLALMDYKAVLFDKSKNILVIPASLTDVNNVNYQTSFQGSLVFTVTDTGITERGRVNFRLPQDMSGSAVYIDDVVRRNLYINDVLYSVSPATVKTSQLEAVDLISSLTLPQRSSDMMPGVSPLLYVQDQTLPEPAR